MEEPTDPFSVVPVVNDSGVYLPVSLVGSILKELPANNRSRHHQRRRAFGTSDQTCPGPRRAHGTVRISSTSRYRVNRSIHTGGPLWVFRRIKFEYVAYSRSRISQLDLP